MIVAVPVEVTAPLVAVSVNVSPESAIASSVINTRTCKVPAVFVGVKLLLIVHGFAPVVEYWIELT